MTSVVCAGPAQVPMMSPNVSVPPIYVPPGYAPQVCSVLLLSTYVCVSDHNATIECKQNLDAEAYYPV